FRLGPEGEERQHAVGARPYPGAGKVPPDDAADTPQIFALERLDHLLGRLLALGEDTEAVDVDHDQHVLAGHRVAEVASPPLGRGFVAVAALGEVVEELASD